MGFFPNADHSETAIYLMATDGAPEPLRLLLGRESSGVLSANASGVAELQDK